MKPDTAMPDHLHGHVCRYISNPGARDQVLDCIDAALLEAHQRGRREGMEEAAKVADDNDAWADGTEIAAAIRAKMEEQP